MDLVVVLLLPDISKLCTALERTIIIHFKHNKINKLNQLKTFS